MAKKTEEKTIPLELVGGSNLTKIKKDVHEIYKRVKRRKEQIAELNAENQADRETVKAMGIPKKAFDDAFRRHHMDPEKRAEYDHGFQITAEAIGSPIDLFTPADEKNDSNPKSAPKAASAKKPKQSKKAAAAEQAEGDKVLGTTLDGATNVVNLKDAKVS